MLTTEKKQIIINKLLERISRYQCPICHNDSCTIVDGYLANTLQNDFSSMKLGGSFLPSVALVCNKCGFTSMHNAKVLGIEELKENLGSGAEVRG